VAAALTLPVDIDISLLRSCWRHATDALRSRVACPSGTAPLGTANWAEHDDALHALLVAGFRRIPAQFVRGMVISTGGRVDLHACGDPMWVDADALSLLVTDVGAMYYDIRAGRRSALDDETDDGITQTPASTVIRQSAPAIRPELVVLRDADRPHLHLYYPSIGAEAAYQQLTTALPASWTVTACADADHADSVEEMATWYLSALSGRFSQPDLLGGWSMGGLVGLEAARRLSARDPGSRPNLVLVDSPPPGVTEAVPTQQERLEEFAEFLWRSFGIGRFRPRQLDTSGEDQVGLSLLAQALRHAGEEVPVGWLAEWLTGYRRQRRLRATYRCGKPVPASGLLVVGELPDAHVEAWRRALDGSLTVRRTGGEHFDLLRPPLVTDVARLLASYYATCEAGS
jgi:thioesterase domain-containing protein